MPFSLTTCVTRNEPPDDVTPSQKNAHTPESLHDSQKYCDYHEQFVRLSHDEMMDRYQAEPHRKPMILGLPIPFQTDSRAT